jgi:hypothetical protein
MSDESCARRVAVRLLNTRDIIRDALIGQIGDTFDCTRSWSAWSVGTMSENDFVPVVERMDDIVDAVIKKLGEPNETSLTSCL